jgi:hypothetical protein
LTYLLALTYVALKSFGLGLPLSDSPLALPSRFLSRMY